MTVAGLYPQAHKAERPGGNRGGTVVEQRVLAEPLRSARAPSLADGQAPGKRDVPAMAHAYALAAELARPVDAGYLTSSEALAALLVAALAAERGGSYQAPAIFKLQRHLFAQRLGQLTVQRQIAEGKERLQNWRQRHG